MSRADLKEKLANMTPEEKGAVFSLLANQHHIEPSCVGQDMDANILAAFDQHPRSEQIFYTLLKVPTETEKMTTAAQTSAVAATSSAESAKLSAESAKSSSKSLRVSMICAGIAVIISLVAITLQCQSSAMAIK